MQSFGKNVLLSTEPKKIKKVLLSSNQNDPKIIDYLKKNNIHYERLNSQAFLKYNNLNHQGVIIIRDDYNYCQLAEVLTEDFLVILDHLEDPHNFGAIIRTCEAAGIKGIIIPKDRSVTVNETVMKTSVGTTEYVKIAKVTNLVDTIKKLQKENYFIYGSAMNGKDFNTLSFPTKKVLIIGNEGKGMSSLVQKNCDEILKIPMKGKVNSLNASVSAALLIYKMEGY